MREHDFTTLFKTEHMLKDVRLCLEEAQAAGIPFPSAAHARDLLTATLGRGHGEDDYAAIIEAAEGLRGQYGVLYRDFAQKSRPICRGFGISARVSYL